MATILDMNEELASIIMPVFNASSYLIDSVGSVLNQTYKSFELICIDDCSTDNSLAILQTFASKDPRVVVKKTEVNGGSGIARNIGLRCAKGKYICFLDADDMYKPRFLIEQILFLQNHGPFVFSSYDRLWENHTYPFLVRSKVNVEDCLRGCDISCLTAVFDSSILGVPLFDESVKMQEDLLYWISLLSKTKYAFGNSDSLAIYRIVRKSKSKKKVRGAFILFWLYRKKLKLSVWKSFLYLLAVVKYSRRKYKNIRWNKRETLK